MTSTMSELPQSLNVLAVIHTNMSHPCNIPTKQFCCTLRKSRLRECQGLAKGTKQKAMNANSGLPKEISVLTIILALANFYTYYLPASLFSFPQLWTLHFDFQFIF